MRSQQEMAEYMRAYRRRHSTPDGLREEAAKLEARAKELRKLAARKAGVEK